MGDSSRSVEIIAKELLISLIEKGTLNLSSVKENHVELAKKLGESYNALIKEIENK